MESSVRSSRNSNSSSEATALVATANRNETRGCHLHLRKLAVAQNGLFSCFGPFAGERQKKVQTAAERINKSSDDPGVL